MSNLQCWHRPGTHEGALGAKGLLQAGHLTKSSCVNLRPVENQERHKTSMTRSNGSEMGHRIQARTAGSSHPRKVIVRSAALMSQTQFTTRRYSLRRFALAATEESNVYSTTSNGEI